MKVQGVSLEETVCHYPGLCSSLLTSVALAISAMMGSRMLAMASVRAPVSTV